MTEGLIAKNSQATNIILAALSLRTQEFQLQSFYPKYHDLITMRGCLIKTWRCSPRGGIQRICGNSKCFKGRLNIFSSPVDGSGVYRFRDEYYHKLLDAANANSDILLTDVTSGLLFPVEGDLDERATSNEIGTYAQRLVMDLLVSQGYKIIDTSSYKAYDITFLPPGRREKPRVCEVKGTTKPIDDATFTLTPNEMVTVPGEMFAAVTGIRYVRGKLSGGDIRVVDNFNWHDVHVHRGVIFKLK